MKRIFFAVIRKHDLESDTCLIRELEMCVDAIIRDQGYRIQFWRDMNTYGLSEAITYLRNSHEDRDFADIDAIAKRIVGILGVRTS